MQERVLMYKLNYKVLWAGVFWVNGYDAVLLVLVKNSGAFVGEYRMLGIGLCGCSVLCKTLNHTIWASGMWGAMHLCMIYMSFISFYYVSNE
jgi:hypothetical protein